MSSNKKTAVQTISIDEIINTVVNFDYNIDSTSSDDNQPQKKTKKSNSIAKIRKENLAKLLAIISNLKGAAVGEESTREFKIKALYELVKTKLNSDLYLFNIQIVAKFLQGYKSTEADKLDKSIISLFNVILEEVELSKILPNYNLQSNLFYDEDKLKEIVKSAKSEKLNDEDNTKSTKTLSNIYLNTILKNRLQVDFYKQLFMVERVMAEHLAEFKQKDKSKYLLISLSEALSENDPKLKIRSCIYLYFTTYINELEEEVDSLSNKLSSSHISVEDLLSRVKSLTEQLKERDITLTQLTEQGNEKDETITNLQTELTTTSNRLEYEVNKYEIQLHNLKTGLIERLQSNIQMELDGLNDFANGLPQNDCDILRMYVTNIQQLLNTL